MVSKSDFIKSLPDDVKLRIAKEKPLKQVLAILAVLYNSDKQSALTVSGIEDVARSIGIKLTKDSILGAVKRAGDRILSDDSEPKKLSISIIGLEEINDILEIDGPTFYYIKSGKPYEARKKSDEIISICKGRIFIVDPYFDGKSFLFLEKFDQNANIKFITSNIDMVAMLPIYIDFKKEYPKFELRVYKPKNTNLHDRYIISDNKLVILGHGLKDLGKKESFVIVFDKNLVEDLMKTLKSAFNDKWKEATELS